MKESVANSRPSLFQIFLIWPILDKIMQPFYIIFIKRFLKKVISTGVPLPTKLKMNEFIFVQSICWSVRPHKGDQIGSQKLAIWVWSKKSKSIFYQNQLYLFLVSKEIEYIVIFAIQTLNREFDDDPKL